MTNETFEHLLSLAKQFDDATIKLPTVGETKILHATSCYSTEKFIVDTDRRGKIELKKIKLQNRHSTKELLLRVEIDCPPHTNPDYSETSRNHIHIYKEGYDLRWAYDLETFHDVYFKNIYTFDTVFIDFCKLCNIQLEETIEMQSVL
ncbi:DUF6978 family protein [Acetobacterium tundrae]|uniref:Lj965 prophage protein n=1 Tax=Acetobacterium tundrae TaxID=132932 RepID=A0ABR6WQR4_9FIRM|nr:hypothetical protein [Acetobacterium tundrae]MBC3798462.1 hypothetical protein [Acetobacterium tundrae]